MASGASLADYAENKVLDHLTGKTSYSMPTAYIALSTTTVTDAGGNVTEPAGGSYARVTTSGGDWNAASSGSTTNAVAITFTTATGTWGAITDYVVYDASTSGNVIGYGVLDDAQTILSGDTASFAIDAFTITLD